MKNLDGRSKERQDELQPFFGRNYNEEIFESFGSTEKRK